MFEAALSPCLRGRWAPQSRTFGAAADGKGKDLTFEHRALQAGRYPLHCVQNVFLIKTRCQKPFRGKGNLGTRTILLINSSDLLSNHALLQPAGALKELSTHPTYTLPQSLQAETMPPSRKEIGNKNSCRISYLELFPFRPKMGRHPPHPHSQAQHPCDCEATFTRSRHLNIWLFPEWGMGTAFTVQQSLFFSFFSSKLPFCFTNLRKLPKSVQKMSGDKVASAFYKVPSQLKKALGLHF